MIEIAKSQNADTRSAVKLVTREELLQQSNQHISDVRKAMNWMIEQIYQAASRHDYTKVGNIDEFHEDFELIQKGEVVKFKEMNWFKNIHLKERHHLNDRCPEDVNLFDVLESIADITMAGMARTGKIYDDKLDADILVKAYANTIELLKNQIVIK